MIKQILYEIMHEQPFGTDELVDIHSIIIPQGFREKKNRPSKQKMIACRQRYHELGFLDKPIEVQALTNENGNEPKLFLVDKYTRLCVAYEFGLKLVPIKYISILN